MKKYLLKLLLFSCFLIFGFASANAAATFGPSSTTGFYSTTLTASGTNQGVFGFSYNNTTGYNIAIADFSTSVSPTFFSNFKLYESTTNSLATAESSGTLLATSANGDFNQTSATDLTANFETNVAAAANTTYYFFLVADFTLPAASTTFSINTISVTRANGAVITGTATAINYTITVPPAVTITATSLNTSTNPTQPTAGLVANPIAATATKLPVYGLKLATSATGATQTISALNFTQAGGQTNDYYMANAYLYSSSSPTYAAGTSALLKTITGVGATTSLNFTGLSISAAANQNLYYFVLIDYTTPVAAAANFQLNFTSATGATVTGTPAGYSYNFSALTLTATSLNTSTNPTQPTAGLTANPIAATGTKLPVYGLQIAASGTGPGQTITALNFTQGGSQVNSYYMANAYLYSSTSATYSAGTSTLVKTITGVGATTTLNFTGLSIPVATGQTLYYFVLIDYSTAVDAAVTFQLNFTSATGATVTGTPQGYSYNFPVLTITATSLNTSTNPTQPTAGLVANPISATGTGLPIYGLQLAATGTAPAQIITALNFTQSGGQNNNYYMANAYLYSSTSATYSAGTSTLVKTITGVTASTALNFTGLNISVATGQTLYYFVLIDYNTAVAAAANFQLNFTSATGATVTGTPAGYQYNFTLLAFAATSLNTSTNPTQPTAGLTPNPIGALGTGLPVYGLQLAATTAGPAKTITALNFTQVGGQVNSYYIANAYLYSSTSATYSAGTSTLVKTITGVPATTALNFTGLTIPVSTGQTLYYFVLVDYNTATAAAANFQLNFTSATGATVTGTPAGYQYNFTSLTITATALGVTGGPTNGLTANLLRRLRMVCPYMACN
jgi:hypothetical protein